MIMLIGGKSKTEAIRRLMPSLNSLGDHKKIHLQLVPGNIEARSPVLIADCELLFILHFYIALGKLV